MTLLPLGRLAIVDDEVELRKALSDILCEQGYETQDFASGREALAAMRLASFDLLLTDLQMPEMDGIALLREALTLDPDLIGIMLTGHGTVATAVETMRVGAFDYVLKPFQLSALVPILSRAMEVRRLKRRARDLSLQNAHLSRQLEAERSRAGTVQAELLPRDLPEIPGFDLSARCIPAREVGGDFYDWQEPRPGLLTLTLADVMGKGMPAALLMATVRATLRAVALHHSPAEALGLVQKAMASDFERTGSFATVFHAQLDVPSRCVRYVDAGHGHVFIRRANGAVEQLTKGGPPLGFPLEKAYREDSSILQPHDFLVVYSDGLVDVRPDYPLSRDMLAREIQSMTSAPAMVDRLVSLAGLSSEPSDDLTLLVLLSGAESAEFGRVTN